jgi:hypothetical protein
VADPVTDMGDLDRLLDQYPDAQPGTPLPWRYQADGDVYTHIVRGGGAANHFFVAQFPQGSDGRSRNDATFMALAASAYPGLRSLVSELVSRNKALSEERDALQLKCDIATDALKAATSKPWATGEEG